MIAVVGSPVASRTAGGVTAAGMPVAVAREAARAGAAVELIGKLGEVDDGDGGIGDAVLLSLARDGIGHVALLRQPGDVPVLPEPLPDGERDAPLDPLAEDVDSSDATRGSDVPAGAALDAADLELALRYLPEYAVVVVAETLDAAALRAVVDAAGWAGARLVIASGGADPVNVPDDATLLEPPAVDPEGAFAALVGRYAAALDRGEPPEAAFETASTAAGWTPVAG